MYYNAFTEDLFSWDNDLEFDTARKIDIKPNGFTNFLRDQGQDGNIVKNFQRYTSDAITPLINSDFSEVTFNIARGDDDNLPNIKISKGEESNFIWCFFYSLLESIVEILNTAEAEERETNKFDDLQYIFIDDPVSSLDESHLIELAVNIAEIIKSSEAEQLKFIITTHNPLFYNVLFNEFNSANPQSGYKRKHSIRKRLEKFDDGTFEVKEQPNDSPFAYHLFLLAELDKAIETQNIQKFHFNFLRNILEKLSTFLGYAKWINLLPNETEGARLNYYNRIINLSSHSKHSGEEVSVIRDADKRVLEYLVRFIKENYHFYSPNNND